MILHPRETRRDRSQQQKKVEEKVERGGGKKFKEAPKGTGQRYSPTPMRQLFIFEVFASHLSNSILEAQPTSPFTAAAAATADKEVEAT